MHYSFKGYKIHQLVRGSALKHYKVDPATHCRSIWKICGEELKIKKLTLSVHTEVKEPNPKQYKFSEK